MRPLQLAHFKLYLENAIELEAHRHGVFNGSTSPSLQQRSDGAIVPSAFHGRAKVTCGRVVRDFIPFWLEIRVFGFIRNFSAQCGPDHGSSYA